MQYDRRGEPTGIYACNGQVFEGDLIHYEDETLCFTVQIVKYMESFGFFLEKQFYPLAEFIRIFSEINEGDIQISATCITILS